MILDEWRKHRDIWDIEADYGRRIFEIFDETNRQANYIPFEVIRELIRLHPWILPEEKAEDK